MIPKHYSASRNSECNLHLPKSMIPTYCCNLYVILGLHILTQWNCCFLLTLIVFELLALIFSCRQNPFDYKHLYYYFCHSSCCISHYAWLIKVGPSLLFGYYDTDTNPTYAFILALILSFLNITSWSMHISISWYSRLVDGQFHLQTSWHWSVWNGCLKPVACSRCHMTSLYSDLLSARLCFMIPY